MIRTQKTTPALSLGTLTLGAIPILALALVLAYLFEIPAGGEQQLHSTVVAVLTSDSGLSPVVAVETATGETADITLPNDSAVAIGDQVVVLKQNLLLGGASYEFCHFP